jgi:nucleoside-diphosphate-sugar epimerase
MNILVTGATGFIGKNLCKALYNNHHVIALIRNNSNVKELPQKIEKFKYDSTDNEIEDFFKRKKIDGIIHLAAMVYSGHENWGKIGEIINSNIILGTKLLELSKLYNIKWFINTGTFWQHYNNEDYNPVNLYAATKQAFEDIAKYYTETSDLKFVTLKLYDTFGPNDTRPKIFNLWNKIAKTGEELKMSGGEQIIDISYIDNVIDAYERLIEILNNNEMDINGKSFALKSKKRYTLKQLASLYEKVTGLKLNIKWGALPYREREIMVPWKIGEEIPDYEEKISIEKGLRRFINE